MRRVNSLIIAWLAATQKWCNLITWTNTSWKSGERFFRGAQKFCKRIQCFRHNMITALIETRIAWRHFASLKRYLFKLAWFVSLSVRCNTLHGTEYKITCGVFLCVFLCVRLCVRTGFWGRIYRKRTPIGNDMADRLVTWPMTSRDLERSRSWLRYKNVHYLENGWR